MGVPISRTPYAAFATVYDTLLGDRVFPRLRDLFERLVRLHGVNFDSAADVACGTGTFARHLCLRGTAVVYGVDGSPTMIRIARRKNRDNHARFVVQDLRRLRLPRRVELITCNFDSLNYLRKPADLRRALARFRANLNPRGHAIFDMITGTVGPPRRETVSLPGVTVVRTTRRHPGSPLQVSVVDLRVRGRPRRCPIREVHVQRRYPVRAVLDMLRDEGFRVAGVHNALKVGAPTASKSSRVVFVARRA